MRARARRGSGRWATTCAQLITRRLPPWKQHGRSSLSLLAHSLRVLLHTYLLRTFLPTYVAQVRYRCPGCQMKRGQEMAAGCTYVCTYVHIYICMRSYSAVWMRLHIRTCAVCVYVPFAHTYAHIRHLQTDGRAPMLWDGGKPDEVKVGELVPEVGQGFH